MKNLIYTYSDLFCVSKVDWQGKGGSYWVRFIHIEMLGFSSQSIAPPPIKVGDRVRVKSSVSVPKFKWGYIDYNSVGIVTSNY
jgi:E3 ubiquitin-protein ligase HERC2